MNIGGLGKIGLLTLLLVSSCRFSLPKDLYKLHNVRACEDLNAADMVKKVEIFEHATKTQELKCALAQLRMSDDQTLSRTATGAKTAYLLADRHRDPKDREQLAAEGVKWAQNALDSLKATKQGVNRDVGCIHYYLAINLGIVVHEHTAMAVKNLNRLVEHLKTAVQWCPDEEQGGALRVLGLLYLMAPPWPKGIGDGDLALEMLGRAAKEYPQHPLNHIFYAQVLWELEEAESEQQIRDLLQLGRDLLEKGNWGTARKRWQNLAQDLAKKTGMKHLPKSKQ